MEQKNRHILLDMFHDMEAFAQLKRIKCPPVYLLGGSGCIMAGYLERTTLDIDFLDIGYAASAGRLFSILGKFDMLDLFVTPVAPGFEERAMRVEGFSSIYVLSREDIIVSKLGRYSEKDREDIEALMDRADKVRLKALIQAVIKREDFSSKVKNYFIKNAHDFGERYNV